MAKKKKAKTIASNGSTMKPGSPSGKAVPTKPPHYAKPGKVNHIRGKIGKAAGDKATHKGMASTTYKQPSHRSHGKRG